MKKVVIALATIPALALAIIAGICIALFWISKLIAHPFVIMLDPKYGSKQNISMEDCCY
jgi:hypothetical protein